ncbi:hepatocellular carcinoma-associated antigen 59-domain-containing protein [Chaetomium sp. MPI-SDFR-AT-0129]|nr:hepatocellular carcinoma-associated antigen 59-domain-containing protein [Chaetomium sp. MPI-SDFR-AT-0129]
MEPINAEPDAAPPILFRPGKKRKNYRQRATEETDNAIDSNTTGEAETAQARVSADPPPSGNDGPMTTVDHGGSSEREEGLTVSEIRRLRNARKHRQGGVGFRASPSGFAGDGATNEENSERGVVLHGSADAQQGAEAAVIGGISRRFAPQTGLVGELVNRHMEEYVESELARRKRHAAEAAAAQEALEQQQQQSREDSTTSTTGDGRSGTGSAPLPTGQIDSQRVMHGRLLEIDLGDEARARNIEMTERARRRLQGQIEEEEREEADGRQRKVRLGRDGKPLRSRNRRGSDDIQRDKLVEEFLSENRIDMYDSPSDQAAHQTTWEEEDGAADDRIAEEFRRDFMDAMAQRNRRRRATNAPKPGPPKNKDEILRGPKLGGSRNARAAMRDILLKEQVANKGRR